MREEDYALLLCHVIPSWAAVAWVLPVAGLAPPRVKPGFSGDQPPPAYVSPLCESLM
jgi:hypothetical protein